MFNSSSPEILIRVNLSSAYRKKETYSARLRRVKMDVSCSGTSFLSEIFCKHSSMITKFRRRASPFTCGCMKLGIVLLLKQVSCKACELRDTKCEASTQWLFELL